MNRNLYRLTDVIRRRVDTVTLRRFIRQICGLELRQTMNLFTIPIGHYVL